MVRPPEPEVRGASDEELIARVLAGDDDSYRVLVERYSDYVYAIVIRIVGDEEDAADVAQKAFVRAHRALVGFRGDSKFGSWLYRIAVNRALTHLQRRRRRPVTVDIAAYPGEVPNPSARRDPLGPAEQALAAERRERVRGAVGALPPKYRAAVTLFYLEERSYQEVAEILGVPMGTLKTHLHRARAMLREALEERVGGDGRGE
jgi:RNA polymerase sigma-70 factor (ECF subfamily)